MKANGTEGPVWSGESARPPKATSVKMVDFWPACLHAEEGFANPSFERFDTLFPRLNAWLRQNPLTDVLKCETLEKKISSPEQLGVSNPKFDIIERDKNVFVVKGLRLWYKPRKHGSSKHRLPALQLGYRNFVPRCLESHPQPTVFEDLTALYNSINEELDAKPLEGPIVTMETIGLHVSRSEWEQEWPDIKLDKCQWQDLPQFHIFYFTRIFYFFQCPAYEQVGAADFLPDPDAETSASPKYSDFSSIMVKVNAWLEKVKDIRIVNIETLKASFPGLGKADKLNTGRNFLDKADASPLVQFVRVTYVRPKYGLPPGGLRVPRLITYKTFIPSPIADKATKGVYPEYESMAAVWDRVLVWLENSGQRPLGVEVGSHPLSLLHNKRDDAETTMVKGTWVFTDAKGHALDNEVMQRVPFLELLRVYYSGVVKQVTTGQPEVPAVEEGGAKAGQDASCAVM